VTAEVFSPRRYFHDALHSPFALCTLLGFSDTELVSVLIETVDRDDLYSGGPFLLRGSKGALGASLAVSGL
jgi:hypothetical protein